MLPLRDGIPLWPTPPSTGLKPFASDDELIDLALAGLEYDLVYVVDSPFTSDRAVQRERLAQVRDLQARRSA